MNEQRKPPWAFKLEEIAAEKGLEVSYGPAEDFVDFLGEGVHACYINDFGAGWSVTIDYDTSPENRLRILEAAVELERWRAEQGGL